MWEKGIFTFRKIEKTKKELIGGVDVYMPICRQHYVSGLTVVEAARTMLESRKLHHHTQSSCLETAASAL